MNITQFFSILFLSYFYYFAITEFLHNQIYISELQLRNFNYYDNLAYNFSIRLNNANFNLS